MGCLGAGAILLLVACLVIVFFVLGPGNLGDFTTGPLSEDQAPETGPSLATQQAALPTREGPLATEAPLAITRAPTRTPGAAATQSAPAASGGDKWLVMLYQDADDKILEQDIYIDLNEAELASSGGNVQVVAQVDRYRGGFSGDGDWTSTKRFLITSDPDLGRVRSQEVADLGEVNMADGASLVDFVTWATQNYPADKYALILSDHGMGWPGGWSDPTAPNRGEADIPLSQVIGDQLYLMELDQSLETLRSQTGIQKLDLIGLDACLMGQLEVLTALAPHARAAVVSQETEPALGWAYTSFLNSLHENPGLDGPGLARLIVDSYIVDDQRIINDQARAEFLRQGSPLGSLFGGVSAEQLADQVQQDITLTAVDLEAIPALNESVNRLAYMLQNADQRSVAQARAYARSFTNIFGSNVPPSYIDLGNFLQLVARNSNDAQLNGQIQAVQTALNGVIITEKHGANKRGATGVSIYFPNSSLYKSPAAGPQSYTAIARRFATESLWDDYLTYHYTGRSFEASAAEVVVPERSAEVSAPGAGQITVSPIRLSADVAAPGQPVQISADISGENIGYIKLFVGFVDQAANSIFVADLDYLESGDTREVDGIYYPDWGQGEFTLELDWEPTVFAINDGAQNVPALFNPETFGADARQAVYTVEAIYNYQDGERRNARLYFQAEVMRQVFGIAGTGDTGAPWEIVPQSGDSVTLLEHWIDLDENGKVIENATQEGATLTFGERTFTWTELDAAQGEYVIGFIIEDLDGNEYAVYAPITVQ
jgi:hypothetical protein